eukprot:1159269-Pelagomonas_calceolata.AAC.7
MGGRPVSQIVCVCVCVPRLCMILPLRMRKWKGSILFFSAGLSSQPPCSNSAEELSGMLAFKVRPFIARQPLKQIAEYSINAQAVSDWQQAQYTGMFSMRESTSAGV